MGKYLVQNYTSGSILERASYAKSNFKLHVGSEPLIQTKIAKRKNRNLWQIIRSVIGK